MGTEMMVGPTWGTWEELLLGGAVLRHGTHDWGLVAAGLRARTLSPFTPEVCKAKYEELQQHYYGCTALFEVLRKKRIAELKEALEVSEDSIGSLETRLETLNAERKGDSQASYDSSRTESDLPCQKFDEVDFSRKETSKDGLSAGSFTQETRVNWSSECKVPTCLSAEEMQTRPEVSVSPWSGVNVAEVGCARQKGTLKGRRSKRKSKYISKDITTEASVVESFLGSAAAVSAALCRENSTGTCSQDARSSGIDDKCGCSNNDKVDDIMGIFNSIAENKCASVFRRRLDSQKRGRYKKMIMQHLDFDMIKSRIASGCITSAKQVLRDLLLLASNALVFYSKTTREYKSALLLREIVTKSLKQQLKFYIRSVLNPPSSTCTLKPKFPRKVKKLAKATNVGKRVSTKKKGSGRTKIAASGSAGKRPGRKRSWNK